MTKKKLKLDKKPQLPVNNEVPGYAKFTATQIAKDREYERIKDEGEKKKKIASTIEAHNIQLRKDK